MSVVRAGIRWTHGARIPRSAGILALAVASACGGSDGAGGAVSPSADARLTVSFTALPALDTTREGHYAIWLVPKSGAPVQLATMSSGETPVTRPLPAGSFERVDVTLEPPGDNDAIPSSLRLLTGTFSGGAASLEVVGALTVGTAALRTKPGQFTMFSPSDNAMYGYPSNEESGIWLFNMAPRETDQGDMWVRLTPLREGWTYEGWLVRDYGLPGAIWLSYGKFLPDQMGAVNTRDDTGWGYFSGVPDFRLGEEEFPGDDWIDNLLGLPFPSELSLPLNLRERNATGDSRWTHLITVEPDFDRGEAVGSERPFVVRPYRDPFGDLAPGTPRAITFRPEGVPRGQVQRQ